MTTIHLTQLNGGDDIRLLQNAINYLRQNPNTTLVIPPRKYIISGDEARRLQRDVMMGKYGNNPEGYMFTKDSPYSVGLDFSGVAGAVIEASGATFMIDGFMEPVSLQHCENVTINGLTIDHVRKPYSKGVIVGSGQGYTDVRFTDALYINEHMPSPRIAVVGRNYRLYERITDCNRKERVDDYTLRFHGFSYGEYADCEIYIWHTFHSRPAILIYEARDTVLNNITIHSQPGMGIVGHRSHNITMNGLKVVPSCGEAMSTNTDATHFISCTGKIRFDGCQFEGQGDDSTNVHGYYYAITNANQTSCTLTVEVPTHSGKLDYPNVGDVLELSRKSDLAPIARYTVADVMPDFENFNCVVTLDKPLPKEIDDCYLANATATPTLEIVNCHIRNHISRGILVKTRHVLIDGCIFEYNTGTAIHIAAEESWREGISAKNVVIRNNRMIGSGHQGWGKIFDAGGVSINIMSQDPRLPVHENILIENNIIDCPQSKHAIYVANVDGLTIRGNQLRCQNVGDEVKIVCCSNVTASDCCEHSLRCSR